jgi:hypothetical protein
MGERREEDKKEFKNRSDESVLMRIRRKEGRGLTIAKRGGRGGIVPHILNLGNSTSCFIFIFFYDSTVPC